MPNNQLSPQEKRVRKLLVKKRDTSIQYLFGMARGYEATWRGNAVPLRRMQQDVGAIIARINRKIADQGLVVRVGKARGTYRLYDLTD